MVVILLISARFLSCCSLSYLALQHHTVYFGFCLYQFYESNQAIISRSIEIKNNAWYSTAGQYWLDSPILYWTDGSYSLSSGPTVGGKIVYKKTNGTVTHSGIVSVVYSGASPGINYNHVDLVDVTSKWGMLGLYRHAGVCCPYWNGDNVNYPNDGAVSNTVVYYN